jgi:hypothetical protein
LASGDTSVPLTGSVGVVGGSTNFPVVTGPAGELPIAHAPAGLRRILGLAYLVVWAWREHKIAAGLKKRPPRDSLVLLIDEVENHLHPSGSARSSRASSARSIRR